MYKFCLPKYSKAIFISNALEVTAAASYSASMTVSAYLSYLIDQRGPPGCPKSQKQVLKNRIINDDLKCSIYFEPWCDYINSLHWNNENGRVYKVGQTLIYQMVIKDQQLFNDIRKLGQDYFTCKQQVNRMHIEQTKKNIMVFNFSASQLQTDIFKPKINLINLYTGIWYENGDSWKVYQIFKKQLPTDQEFDQAHAVFLTGSSFSVSDNSKEVQNAFIKLNQALSRNSKLKAIGLCFGHQGLSKYSGCNIIKHKLLNGLIKVKIDSTYLSNFSTKIPSQIIMAQYHSDSADSCPQNFEIFGKSEFCYNQCMISKTGQVLSFQCHPQYSIQYNRSFAGRVTAYSGKQLFDDFGMGSNQQLQSKQAKQVHKQSIQAIRILVRQLIEK